MEIDGGGADTGVVEHFFEVVDGASALGHQRGEGMAEQMRVEVDSAFFSELVHHAFEGCFAELCVLVVTDEKVWRCSHASFAFLVVGSEDGAEPGTDGHHAIFSALAVPDE